MDALGMTVLVMGRVLKLEELSALKIKTIDDKNLESFIEKGVLSKTNSLDEIIKLTEQFISLNK